MITYQYKCDAYGHLFEHRQSITAPALTECPECGGPVRRVITGGSGFILKTDGAQKNNAGGELCALETTGKTCCGLNAPCGKSPCGTAE